VVRSEAATHGELATAPCEWLIGDRGKGLGGTVHDAKKGKMERKGQQFLPATPHGRTSGSHDLLHRFVLDGVVLRWSTRIGKGSNGFAGTLRC
jgi:hypothetical protein